LRRILSISIAVKVFAGSFVGILTVSVGVIRKRIPLMLSAFLSVL